MKPDEAWQKCVDFHGHECGGLTIGYKAAMYAIELLGLKFSEDEQVVCIAENDACGVDAIQVLLGCSVGKGNLLFHMTGKQAYSIFNRSNGQSIRLLLKNRPEGIRREESLAYFHSLNPEQMFKVMPTRILIPEPARLFDSFACEACGETTGSHWIRLQGEKKLCLDCFSNYDRFDV